MTTAGDIVAADLFVGRERELAAFDDVLRDVCAGRARCVLIAGEPGVGKTRLAEAFAARAVSAGAEVLRGRGWEGQGAPSYWPWMQVVRAFVRGHDADTLRATLGSGAADIAQAVPDVARRLPDLVPPPRLEFEQARLRLYDSFTGFLRAAAARGPLALLLDDLHWADVPSLRLLAHVLDEIGDTSLLVVGGYRDTEIDHAEPQLQLLAETARAAGACEIALRGLEIRHCREFVAGAVGDVADAAAEVLHRATGGNPFFVGELVRWLAAEGQLSPAHDPATWTHGVPPGVRAVVAARLDALSPATHAWLVTAAVFGPEFHLDLLQHTRDGEPEGDTAAIARRLGEAVRAGLVVPNPRAAGRYRFAHALVRETLLATMAAAERARIHRAAAVALEAVTREIPDRPHAELAHHYVRGGSAGDLARAVEHASRAGDRAMAALAWEDGARLYQLALEALDQCPDVAPRARTGILLSLATALWRSGDEAAGRERFDEVAAIARTERAAPLFARAVFGRAGFIGEYGKSDPALVALLGEAVAMIADADDRLRVRLLGRLAQEVSFVDFERAVRLSAEAVTVARRTGDPSTLVVALQVRVAVARFLLPTAELAALLDELERALPRTTDVETEAEGRLWLGLTRLHLGAVDGFRAEVDALDRIAVSTRNRRNAWAATMYRTVLALLHGDLDDGERLMHEAVALGQRAGNPNAAQAFGTHLLVLRETQGELREMRETIAGLVQWGGVAPTVQALLCHLLAADGDLDGARRELNALAARGFDAYPRELSWLVMLSDLSTAAVALGDRAHAATLYDLMLPFADRVVDVGAMICRGSAARYLGMLAGVAGRIDDAVRHFDAALAANAALGARPALAFTQVEYAAMLHAAGLRPDDVRSLCDQAGEIARAVGMRGLLARIAVLQAPSIRVARGCTAYRDGDFWAFRLGDETARIRDLMGARILALLLERPGVEVPAAVLAAVASGAPNGDERLPTDPDAATVTLDPDRDDGPPIDARAAGAYRDRLRIVTKDLAAAEADGDVDRAEQLREEAEFLNAELSAGQRHRRPTSHGERARVMVAKALDRALRRIHDRAPAVGRHLDASLRRGASCTYRPSDGT